MAGILDHKFDSANVITEWEHKSKDAVVESICYSVKDLRERVELSYAAFINLKGTCFSNVAKKDDIYKDNSLYSTSEVNLKKHLIKMLLATFKDKQFVDYAYRLRKLLLTFFFNQENVTLFFDNLYCSEENVSNLINFHYNFLQQITEYCLFMCDTPPTSVSYDLSGDATSYITKNNAKLENYMQSMYQPLVMILNNMDEPLTGTNIRPTQTRFDDEFDFDVVKMCELFISQNLKNFHGPRINFYWKRNGMSIERIKNEYTLNPFNLHNVIEFQLLTVKWVISYALYVFIKVLNGSIFYSYNHKNIEPSCFDQQLNYLTPLFNEKSNLFISILVIFESFHNFIHVPEYDTDMVPNLKKVIINQLNSFGVVLETLPLWSGKDICEEVKNVCDNVTALKNSNFSNLMKSVGMNKILIDIPTFYSRFEEEFYGSTK